VTSCMLRVHRPIRRQGAALFQALTLGPSKDRASHNIPPLPDSAVTGAWTVGSASKLSRMGTRSTQFLGHHFELPFLSIYALIRLLMSPFPRIVTVVTETCPWNLLWASSIHILTPCFSNTHFNIFLLSTPTSPDLGLPLRFSDQNYVVISHFSHACFTSRPSHPPWFRHPTNISRRAQTIKVLQTFVTFSHSAQCSLISLISLLTLI